jgi:uncharacterized protein
VRPTFGGPRLGAPGVYRVLDEPVRALTGEPMDVAAFVGVAPRGPARLPALAAPWAEPPRGPAARAAALRSVAVAVESWDEYRRAFGGFEAPGLLPFAVASFFEQGGRRAFVVRVVHDYGAGAPENDAATAGGVLPGATVRGGGGVRLLARDEGSWGNGLRAALSFRARPLPFVEADAARVVLPPAAPVGPGTLLRLRAANQPPELRFVSETALRWRADRPVRDRHAILEQPLPWTPERAEVVEAALDASDAAPDGLARREVHDRLGLSPLHPRWLAAVLHRESALLRPHPEWIGEPLDPDDVLLAAPAPPEGQFAGGVDRWDEVVPEDFFDPLWIPGDEQPRGGIHALAEVEEVAVVVVPDLYSPFPVAPRVRVEEPLTHAGEDFASCVEPAPPAADADPGPPELEGLRLDPATELDAIAALQARVVELAEAERRWVALLDVPPGLEPRSVLAWRAGFDSAWAAAYHPWLRAARPDDPRAPLVSLPPSAVAAGILARQERAFGVPHGPANVIAVGPVALLEAPGLEAAGELHQDGVNLFGLERDGVRLTAARTLSRDPRWRQLSVRRLMTMLGAALRRQMQWTVFEPNRPWLRDELQRMLEAYLRGLHTAGALRGRTPEEAFFVRCDDALNPPAAADAGTLVCQVGVAPAEPLEFIVLRLTREGDGTLLLEG